jgi:hypothetical protein
MLKKDRKKLEDAKGEEISLEDLIEKEVRMCLRNVFHKYTFSVPHLVAI